ncbi:MAG: ABC transporter ATP-binding protein [Eubacteriales bacterium]
MSNAIELKNVNKSFKKFKLEDVSFSLEAGYIMGFVGQNGAGKTTTIKLILDMLKVDSGEINIFGLDHRLYSSTIKEEIGVVMDQSYFVDEWTLDEVERAMSPFYSSWDREKYKKLLADFGLDRNKKVKELSRGMNMKLMIATALSHNAKLLILDEPTSGLDPVARDELMEMLREFVLDEEKSVLFSTHITSDLEKIADYITVIQNGKIYYSGQKDELMEKYVMVKGGVSLLNDEMKKELIGLREHSVGFDAIAEKTSIRRFKDIVTENVTLDEIIVRIEKESKK